METLLSSPNPTTKTFTANYVPFRRQTSAAVQPAAGRAGPIATSLLAQDGSLDTSFQSPRFGGTPAVPAGLRFGLMQNGQVLLAGGSGVYHGATVNGSLFRLNANGTIDHAYAGYKIDLVNVAGLIGRFLPTPSGSIYCSGAFDKMAGQTLHGLARLNPDGMLDSSFVPAVYVSPSPGALALQPDGKLIVCASAIAGTTPKWIFARLNGTGGTPVAPGPKMGALTLLANGLIQIQVSGAASQVVVQSSPNLTAWTNLTTNSVVNGLLAFTDTLLGKTTVRFYKLVVP